MGTQSTWGLISRVSSRTYRNSRDVKKSSKTLFKMRRTSRLLRNARKSPSGASTPGLATTISSRSRSCVREYRQQPSRAFHTSHIFNTHNLESNNSKNTPNRRIDLSELKNSTTIQNSAPNTKITPSINSSANVQTKSTPPTQASSSSSTIAKNTSQSSKK